MGNMDGGAASTEAFDHELIVDGVIERRRYQLDIAERAVNEHTLVCLPTGLGKTTVSLLVTAERLAHLDGKSLMLAPTKPLVTQHTEFYRSALAIDDERIITLTGATPPEQRGEAWDDATVIVATPQVIENDLIGSRIDLSDVVHLTFDECHRTGGDYAYGYIADRYHDTATNPLVTGMSASPGEDRDEILEVCQRLGITAIEVRSGDDADVDPYTHETEVEWIKVELPEDILEIRDKLREVTKSRLETLAEMGVAETTAPDCSQRDLNAIRAKLQQMLEAGDRSAYKGLSLHAEVMKLRRALELVETQSVRALRQYFERRHEAARSSGASKADQRFLSDPRVRDAMRMAREYDELHPKFRRARILIAETLGIKGGSRVLVFTESRDTAEQLTAFLGDHFSTERFVGQGDREHSDGMSQREQRETIQAFRDGEFEVLVSTSVAEEGLDVPEVDLVLFFEPVSTAIRSIQRKGRTGRQAPGRVVVLIAKDTRDEAFFWISRRREQTMQDELRTLQSIAHEIEGALRAGDDVEAAADAAAMRDPDQPALDAFDSGPDDKAAVVTVDETEGSTTIIVDQRELDATIGRELSKRPDIDIHLETLSVADYVLSNRVAVERKTVDDFLDSLLGSDRDLFDQVSRLAQAYDRPIVIIEGDRLYERRNVRPEAIRGALASLVADFGVSVFQTRDVNETRELLVSIAKREQRDGGRRASAHGDKRSRTLDEQQEYVVSSIAEVGPVTARSLLETLGSVESVLTASKEELLTVDGVGEVTADRILRVTKEPYTPE